MRLVKVSMERKEHLVGINGCEHSWPCFGKPAIIFHDRGKIFLRWLGPVPSAIPSARFLGAKEQSRPNQPPFPA